MEMVLPICVWEQSVSDEYIASFRDNVRECFALGYMFIKYILKGRVETFWVVIKILANTYTMQVC
jgi:hypothetical protein